jgi:hypothetical protein
MIAPLVLLALVAGGGPPETGSPLEAGSSPHFDVAAEFHSGKSAGTGEVAVTFTAKDPDVRINTVPPPRLKLDEGQKVLAEKPAPKPAGPPAEKYLDTTFPVVFPVAVVGAARGERTVKGAVTYFYCSHREGWCRKGTADVDIAVKR